MIKTLFFLSWIILNPPHVTMTCIEHIPGTDSLKVYCRMSFDNFLHDYQTYDDDRDLSTMFGKQPFPVDSVTKYFNSKVHIYINQKLITGKVIKASLADNDITINLHYRTDQQPRVLTVRSRMLTDWYSDQVNMTIVKLDKFEKGIKLTPEHNEETIMIQ